MRTDRHLIPQSYALPVAAFAVGITTDEAHRMIDNGDFELTIESVERAMVRTQLERLNSLLTPPQPKTRTRARRS